MKPFTIIFRFLRRPLIEDEIYSKVSQETLQKIVNELKNKGSQWYQSQVNTKIHSLYSYAHRKVLLQLLNTFRRAGKNGVC